MVLSIAVVIPVYQGERTLASLVAEIARFTEASASPHGQPFRVTEVILVHDGAIDGSHRVMKDLAARYPFVILVWLSRNYGQHPATLAGMARTTASWVVTMDEDGQHHPSDIGRLLDTALEHRSQLVYAQPANSPPHGLIRNACSGMAKVIFRMILDNRTIDRFSSFRLLDGQIARCLGAYCGPNVYLDSSLSWVVGRADSCPVVFHGECARPSGYTFPKLFQHFWRLLLSSGTKPLRLISLMGACSFALSLLISTVAVWEKLSNRVPVAGWTSLMILVSFFSGCILFSLGIIAEYLGITLHMTMGKPLYLEVSKPVADDRTGGKEQPCSKAA